MTTSSSGFLPIAKILLHSFNVAKVVESAIPLLDFAPFCWGDFFYERWACHFYLKKAGTIAAESFNGNRNSVQIDGAGINVIAAARGKTDDEANPTPIRASRDVQSLMIALFH